ncbi:MAG: hypothetical protein QOC66_1778 [Pseudonocardiales bacterium]|jgi:hypothetical protein|nr:hypothetical protein [Pseudonocardiales bacterium]
MVAKSLRSIVRLCVATMCTLVLGSCSSSGGGSDNGSSGGGGTGAGSTGRPPPPPPPTYDALVDPNVLVCPDVDVEYQSRYPERWRVCGLPDGRAGALINVSDDVEVFAAPLDLSVSATRYDRTSQGSVIQATLDELAQAVHNGTITDSAVPGAGYRFYYALPGDRFGFSGDNESLSRTLASTSLLATTEAGIARTIAASAYTAASTVRPDQTPAQFVLGLANPISSCANAAVTFVGQSNAQTTTLTELVKTTIKGTKACKSAIELLSVSAEDQALRRATESTLAFRIRTIGRHALENKGFFHDFVNLTLTGLGHK